MLKLNLTPDSPVPLFHQIAEALTYAIATGKLQQGKRLPAIRTAAACWEVNMHTVRKAYGVLAGEGLVSLRGPRGTVVTGQVRARADRDLEEFIQEAVRTAQTRFGVSARELGHLVATSVVEIPARPRVYVVECSEAQCEGHSQEIARCWDVDIHPWCLDRKDDLPAGTVVATYFHYNEIRRRWPHRLADINFVTIAPDPALALRVETEDGARGRTVLLVCEFDAVQAAGVVADVSLLFPRERFSLDSRIVERPAEAFLDSESWDWLLLTPRVWAQLTPEEQLHDRVLPVEYKINEAELERLGRDMSWLPASGRGRGLRRAS